MFVFKFSVHDPDGYWDDLRQTANDQAEAEEACRRYLLKRQAEPRGSLVLPFCLEVRSVKSLLIKER